MIMEGKYIFAIVILGLFFLLIFVSFAFLEYARIKDEKLQAWIDERYADKDLNKPDYDHIMSDEEIPAVQTVQEAVAEVNDIDEDVVDDESIPIDTYGKIDIEGIEEITGNYEGNK